jgi:dipeptidyl aminopeptidase/acylaminoacyl peptidase
MTEGRGLCLMSRAGLTAAGFTAMVVDEELRIERKVKLDGILSRARVSPDGRYGVATAFVVGHSYADDGEFSTQTTLIDMETGEKLADLEDFTVTRDGRPVRAVDRNFWGVTFAGDGDTFYATMATGNRSWLIEGSVSSRRARTLRENVECPSLSPDGTRIAYKRRVDDGSVIWRLHVLDLRTMQDAPVTETRMVDDQAEWLDDDTILYGLEGDVWAARADGSGAPRRLLPDALSPAVIRAAAS